MLTKISGLARAIAIILAIVAGFVALGLLFIVLYRSGLPLRALLVGGKSGSTPDPA